MSLADPVLEHLEELARQIAGTEMARLSLHEAEPTSLCRSGGLATEEPGLVSGMAGELVEDLSADLAADLAAPMRHRRAPLIVADASADPQLAACPLVVGPPHIRLYVGLPLFSSAGVLLGSLCVAGEGPGELTSRQLEGLQHLAALASHHGEQLRLTLPRIALSGGVAGRPPPPACPMPAEVLPRQRILAELEHWVAQAATAPFAVVRCRLRDHERIRATFGEAVAEHCLAEACRRLQPVLPARARLGRLAPEELLLLWPHPPSLELLGDLAHRLTACLAGLHRVEDVSVALTMALGIVVARPQGDSSASLLADGALALQRAGRGEGGGWHGLDADARGGSLESFRFASQFHAALEERDLGPVFQPIVDLASGRPRGFEALVRWEHQGQVLPPARFMPQARDAGVTGEVDLLVVEKTLACLPELAQAFADPDPLMLVSLNLSGCMLDDPGRRQRLLHRLEAARLPAGWTLQVELLEEAFSHGSAGFDRFLRQLGDLGVSLAIDDFGTGYSSLARLVSLPIQRVKLDRSFIAQLDSGDQAPRTLLSRMVTLLRDLDLAITAEGVDSALQRDWLLEHGITSAQGYLFAPPLPLEQAIRYLRQPATGGRVLGLPLRMA